MKNNKDVLISATTNKPVTNAALQPFVMWCHVCCVKIAQPMAAVAHFAGKLHLDKQSGGTGALDFGPVKRKQFTDLDAPPSKFARTDRGGGRGGGGRGGGNNNDNYKKFQKPNNMSNENRTNPWAFLGPPTGESSSATSATTSDNNQQIDYSSPSGPTCYDGRYDDHQSPNDRSNYDNYANNDFNNSGYQHHRKEHRLSRDNDREGRGGSGRRGRGGYYHHQQRMGPPGIEDDSGSGSGSGNERMYPHEDGTSGGSGGGVGYPRMLPKRGGGGGGSSRMLPPETEAWNQGLHKSGGGNNNYEF